MSTSAVVFGTGGIAGFLGGVSGVVGPPVILFYLAGPSPARAVRANILMFLLLVDFALLFYFALIGRLEGHAVAVGLILIVPYTLANIAGAAVFNERYERLYRGTAYLIIAGSAVAGLVAAVLVFMAPRTWA